MQFACIVLLLVFAPAMFSQRFFDSPVVMGNLKPGHSINLVCPEAMPELKFEVTVNAAGEVKKAKALKPRSMPVRYSMAAYGFLRNQAKVMVSSWTFRPMLLNNKAVPMRTVITVPCTPQ